MSHIHDESNKYSAQNNFQFQMELENLEKFLGFLIFSGYHFLLQERLYCSNESDFGLPLVKDIFSVAVFRTIKRQQSY